MTKKKEEEMTCAHNSPTYLHLEKLPAPHTPRTGLVVCDRHSLGHKILFPPSRAMYVNTFSGRGHLETLIRAVNTFTRKRRVYTSKWSAFNLRGS